MSAIRDFDDGERWLLESCLKERYGTIVATQPAEVELRIAPGDAQPTACPTLYWEQRGAAFVVAKVGDGRWRTMFFYPVEPGGEQYGAGQPEYDDLVDCVTSVLRAQADHEKQRHGVGTSQYLHIGHLNFCHQSGFRYRSFPFFSMHRRYRRRWKPRYGSS